tara:strand:+ start:52 stop:495 length:444 start_codon:yes stop_codon:yes gene_type:complete
MFHITEKDILDVYKEEGKIMQYKYGVDYLKLMNNISKEISKEDAKYFCVGYAILLKWKNGKSTPCSIKCLNFLKNKNLLPYHPNEITARIVGFLHGDGYLYDSLGGFGFVSKDKNMLLMLRKDIEKEFKIKVKIKKKRDKGDVELIN